MAARSGFAPRQDQPGDPTDFIAASTASMSSGTSWTRHRAKREARPLRWRQGHHGACLIRRNPSITLNSSALRVAAVLRGDETKPVALKTSLSPSTPSSSTFGGGSCSNHRAQQVGRARQDGDPDRLAHHEAAQRHVADQDGRQAQHQQQPEGDDEHGQPPGPGRRRGGRGRLPLAAQPLRPRHRPHQDQAQRQRHQRVDGHGRGQPGLDVPGGCGRGTSWRAGRSRRPRSAASRCVRRARRESACAAGRPPRPPLVRSRRSAAGPASPRQAPAPRRRIRWETKETAIA